MSIQAINWAISFDASNSSEKAILLVLANYVGGDGRCYPGQQNIGKQACCSERTVREILKSLEGRGIIRREERRRKDGSRTSDIIVLVPFDQPANSAGSDEANRQISPNQPANSAGPTTFEPPAEPSAAAAREKSDLESLTSKLIDAAGDKIQPHGALVLAPVLGLLEAGCDLETDILPTIRTLSARLKRPASSWSYFVGAIREAYEARIAAGRGLSQPKARRGWIEGLSPDEARAKWAKTLSMAWSNETWISWLWGPPPGQPGCRVPPDMLTEKDRKMDWFIERQEAAA
ncbi:MAG: helix-turn-helix domain-containing protein [Rhizobiaceae bacterium]